ncbi:RCC1/BLIP-II [Xylariaceae sp. FL0255]|nr:RCC1/BLIP-II [Xylariaceae sp. FL0255]
MEGLFAVGSNGSGQLGLGHKEDVSVPKPVQYSECQPSPEDDVRHIAAGGNHTVLVTASGKVLWSGDSSNGRCGFTIDPEFGEGQKFSEFCLSKSERPGPVLYAACTWDSTILVMADEKGCATEVYTCGATSPGLTARSPALIPGFPPVGAVIMSLTAGFRHVVAVLDNGDVYGWGNGRKGQLGDAKAVLDEPCRITDIPFKVSKAVCSQYATCLIAEPGDGRIVVLGQDKWGLKSEAPAEVPSWATITASWGGIYVLKSDGTLVAWGRDDHGQLPPPNLPGLTQVVAGSEHVVALTEAGEVVTWGWGEHGNCGPQLDEKSGDVKGRWNVLASLKNLPEGSSITTIGAGCATTWINIATDGLFL